VRLLPADFRADFAKAIEADLAERRAAGDRAGLIRRELPSLVGAIVREHASGVWTDATYALRTIRRTPGFTATAVLMLALGTGVNMAMFSVIDAVMLRSPFPNAGQIAIVQVPSRNGSFGSAVPLEKYQELVGAPGPLASIAALDIGPHILTGRGDPQQIDVECVTASMFDVLGTRPLIGRAFDAPEQRPGAAPVMILSYDFWRRLGDGPDIVGRQLTLNQTPVTVVGVMPRGFNGPFTRSDVAAWLPLGRQIAGGGAAGCEPPAIINAFARVRDGLSVERMADAIPGVRLISLDASTLQQLRPAFRVLTAAVACVLLIACFNVGGLQLERTLARRQDMALRVALGASRGRLMRQVLIENALLGLAGAGAGLAATAFTLRGLISLLPANFPHLAEIELNGRALTAAIGFASISGIVAALIPIWQMRRLTVGAAGAGGARVTERRGTWTRRGLVVTEVAVSIVVLIGAALMVQTFLTLRPTSPGFDPAGKTSILLRLQGTTPDMNAKFFSQLFDRLATAPGIRGLAGSTYLPMWGTSRNATWSFDAATATANTNYTTPGFFELLKIQVIAGRTFTAEDTSASLPVAIVNQLLAQRIDPDGRVVGRRVSVKTSGRGNDPAIERTIVGVIGNMRTIGSSTAPRAEAYIPYSQNPIPVMFVVAGFDGRNDAAVTAELRAAVRALRPELAVEDVGPMTAWVNERVGRQRFGAWLLGTFAALAVGLAAVGLMTTLGWWVTLRKTELGVRMALGASRAQVGRLVFRQGLALGGFGILIGCALAVFATRYLAGSLYGVTPLDPRTYAACAAAMLVVSAGAVYLPMRRATAVDPVIALRAE
jgi:putative ABC transport system permease protein